MPPQEIVYPAIGQHFIVPIFDFTRDFTFGGKIEIVCSRQNRFNHFCFVIVGGLVRSADRLIGMFFPFASNTANTPNMSFGHLIDRDELLNIH
jgi:hypothetical protein